MQTTYAYSHVIRAGLVKDARRMGVSSDHTTTVDLRPLLGSVREQAQELLQAAGARGITGERWEMLEDGAVRVTFVGER